MKRGDHLRIPTVSEVVREATAITDPEGIETAATALYDGFEDDDRPVTAAERLSGELLSTVRAHRPRGRRARRLGRRRRRRLASHHTPA